MARSTLNSSSCSRMRKYTRSGRSSRIRIELKEHPALDVTTRGKNKHNILVRNENTPPFGFALNVFLSAFLLFQVQLMMGKYILPWFGGTPAVWTTCMLFFQLLLLGGYLYSHVLSTMMAGRTQAIVHL